MDQAEPLLRTGGHLAQGLIFQLPVVETAQQPDWRGCGNCSALFDNTDPNNKGVCSYGGPHTAAGNHFSLPTEQDVPNTPDRDKHYQRNWTRCKRCRALFWEGGPRPTAPCPAGGDHLGDATEYLLPFDPETDRQPDWRFCNRCFCVFFNGFSQKGICDAAPGGGFHLHAVTAGGGANPSSLFDPFAGKGPWEMGGNVFDSIGYTASNETPNGAFSWAGRMYVFAGIADMEYSGVPRSGDPQVGQYLFGKDDPSQPGAYEVEFLVSPKLGWCSTDEQTRSVFDSHTPAGSHLFLIHDVYDSSRRSGWRCCAQCEAVFYAGNAESAGVCQRGGAHVVDSAIPQVFELDFAAGSNPQLQWHTMAQCAKCASLYSYPAPPKGGWCPAGDLHHNTGELFWVPETRLVSTNLFQWANPTGDSAASAGCSSSMAARPITTSAQAVVNTRLRNR